VTGVQRPAEIVNYKAMGTTPALLGAGLAAGAVVSLGLTLVSAVRQRRRDLALLKALGFTGRQLAVVVAWQSIIPVVVGLIAGIPLGIAAGRWLWDLFARDIGVIPYPTVPAGSIVVVAAGAIVLALVVSVLPGRSAARTPTATILRAE
jgi:ABC-type lipoprotein release transport system permease subunit